DLVRSLGYTTGIEKNDAPFAQNFPYEALPWSGVNPKCGCEGQQENGSPKKQTTDATSMNNMISGKEVSAPDVIVSAYPNPTKSASTIKYRVSSPSNVTISVFDAMGKQVAVLVNKKQDAGMYTVQWNTGSITHGLYYVNAIVNGNLTQTIRI